MKRLRIHASSGQVMIISLLVLGLLTLGFILVGGSSLSQEAQVNAIFENKALSSASATACTEQAMDRLGRNPAYAGNENLTVASSTCAIRPIIVASGTWTIETSATSSNQHTYYRVVLTSISPPTIGSWTELAGF